MRALLPYEEVNPSISARTVITVKVGKSGSSIIFLACAVKWSGSETHSSPCFKEQALCRFEEAMQAPI